MKRSSGPRRLEGQNRGNAAIGSVGFPRERLLNRRDAGVYRTGGPRTSGGLGERVHGSGPMVPGSCGVVPPSILGAPIVQSCSSTSSSTQMPHLSRVLMGISAFSV